MFAESEGAREGRVVIVMASKAAADMRSTAIRNILYC